VIDIAVQRLVHSEYEFGHIPLLIIAMAVLESETLLRFSRSCAGFIPVHGALFPICGRKNRLSAGTLEAQNVSGRAAALTVS
jgi:hypothetical protein